MLMTHMNKKMKKTSRGIYKVAFLRNVAKAE